MTRTRTAAAAVCALLAAGCTGSTAEPTLPSGTPAPTTATPTPTTAATPTQTAKPSPTPTRAEPAASDIEQAVIDYRNIFLDLAPTTPNQVVDIVTAAAETTTTPGGPAYEEALAYARQFEAGEATSVVRGTPYSEALEPPTYNGLNVWSAQVCDGFDGDITKLGDPTPADGDEPFIEPYGITEVILVHSDNHGWLLQDYNRPEAKDVQPCAPAKVREAITTAWPEMLELHEAWGAAETSIEALKPLEAYWNGELLATARENAGSTTSQVSREVYYDLEIALATPERVDTVWCEDPTRDPDGKVIVNATGEEFPLGTNPPTIHRGSWVRDDDTWKLDRWEQSVRGAEGAPEEHRCF